MRKTKDKKVFRTLGKISKHSRASELLRKWLEDNSRANLPRLRKWMKAKDLSLSVTSLINVNDPVCNDHCCDAVKDLKVGGSARRL